MKHFCILIARIALSLIFIFSGFSKAFNLINIMSYMSSIGLAGWLVFPSMVFEVVGGFMILLGIHIKLIAPLLILFCVVTALIFHSDFSNTNELVSMLKNFAMSGGLLLLIVTGSGKYSVNRG